MSDIHEVKERLEIMVQQQSAHHSDVIKKMSDFEKKLNDMQSTINNWKFGGKLTIALFVAVGGLITWILNTLGVHIGLK